MTLQLEHQPLSNALGDFAILPLRFELEALDPLPLQSFAGSAFRGLLGHVLKTVACYQGKACANCSCPQRCAYAYLFETQASLLKGVNRGSEEVPRPFVLQPPRGGRVLQPGEPFALGATLLGNGTEYMPYFLHAMEEMARRGAGQRAARFRVKQALYSDPNGHETVFYQGQRGTLPGRVQRDPLAWPLSTLAERGEKLTGARRVELEFKTPTRLVFQGKPVRRPPLHVVVRALLRRLDLLLNVHGQGPLEVDYRELVHLATQCRFEGDMLRWFDFERYSNRQERKQQMGGVVGRAIYSGPVGNLMPLLLCAPSIQVGKATTFGMGQLGLTVIP